MPNRTLSRRDAFRVGGAALLGAGVLAACGEDTPPDIAVTGTTGPEPTTTTLVAAVDDDLVFLRTAVSFELSAASFYEQVLSGTREVEPELRETALLFQAHHRQHADKLDLTIESLGGEPVTEPNEVFDADLVTAPLAAATTDDEVIEAATTIEVLGSGAYVDAGGSLSRADLRQTAMAVGGSDARHVTYLALLLDSSDPVPAAFAPAEPFPEDALLAPGEITPPAEEGDTTETTEASA
jgi:hypothetical protein